MTIFPRILGIPTRIDWDWLQALAVMAFLAYPAGFSISMIFRSHAGDFIIAAFTVSYLLAYAPTWRIFK